MKKFIKKVYNKVSDFVKLFLGIVKQTVSDKVFLIAVGVEFVACLLTSTSLIGAVVSTIVAISLMLTIEALIVTIILTIARHFSPVADMVSMGMSI